MALTTCIPQDRLRALVRHETLPDRAHGAALFADISGFMPLTEALRDAFGPRRGAKELTAQLEQVYSALIAEIEAYGGSAIDFAGDSMRCWFDAQIAEPDVNKASQLHSSVRELRCWNSIRTRARYFRNRRQWRKT